MHKNKLSLDGIKQQEIWKCTIKNYVQAYSPVWVLEQSIVNVGLLSKTTDLIAITLLQVKVINSKLLQN